MENTNARPATRSHIDLDSKNLKSYATEANLLAALAKLNAHSTHASKPLNYIVARTPSGRWTAIFYGDCHGLLSAGFASIWY